PYGPPRSYLLPYTTLFRSSLVVPTLSLFEVFKRIAQQRGDDEALRSVAVMEQGRVVDLDRATALAAARLSIDHSIAMADSIMLRSEEHTSELQSPYDLVCR